MFRSGHGEQERTEIDTFSETENKEILTVISPEQPTDNLETFRGGQDTTETNMVSHTDKLTCIPLYQTSTDQLMHKTHQTREKFDAGNISGKECHDNVCGKECHGNVCGKKCQGKAYKELISPGEEQISQTQNLFHQLRNKSNKNPELNYFTR
ncbi:unnamed protein product [Mytilus coruscus]|uniref:Uncharacterized protein n=1 Tax=Mytilus coruscus TaxID=42192 RepID=A0A6J8EWC6_MYTCO|nr:unnamed protein product [Mytilus coruscus]